MNNKKILVSAIVSTYNSEKFIRGKIEDLLAQTIVDRLEIIIVNSGSQQNEDAIIEEYLQKYSNIKYIKTDERETIYKAWNRGIKIAEGEFITNANTDDRLKNDAYEILSNILAENIDVGMVYANQILSIKENELFADLNRIKLIKFPKFEVLKQIERCVIGSQPMWMADIHRRNNLYFNEEFEVAGDHDFELSVARKYKIVHIEIALGTFYKSPTRSNKEYENSERNHEEVLKVQKKYLDIYFKSLKKEELKLLKKKYYKFLYFPILLLFLFVKIERKSNPNIYPKLFIHTVEFYYVINMYIYYYSADIDSSIKIGEKFLKYKKSKLIEELIITLKGII